MAGEAGLPSEVPAAGPGGRVDVATTIDLDHCGFLNDHLVRGAVLVPTALQIELVVAALSQRLDSGAGLSLTGISVQDPIILAGGSPVTVRVVGVLPADGAPGRIAVRSADGATHLGLHAAPAADTAVAGAFPGGTPQQLLPGRAELIYPPMFHGPAFRVIDRFGRRGDRLESTLADRLPGWELRESGGGRLAQLVELLLQSCGVWELTQTGRMMRPSHIDRIEVAALRDEAGGGILAEVWPDAADSSAFDGVVRDADGRTRLRMQGYRPVELGPAQPDVVRRLSGSSGSAATTGGPR